MLYVNGVPIPIPAPRGPFAAGRSGQCGHGNSNPNRCSDGASGGFEKSSHFQPPPNFASLLENISKAAESMAGEIASEWSHDGPGGFAHEGCPMFSFMSNAHPNFCRFGMPSKKEKEKSPCTKSNANKWKHCVDCSGFEPQNITAKICGKFVMIKALQETGIGEDKDCREMSRKIAIPDDVIEDDVICQFKDGKLEIEGPRKKTEGKVIDITVIDPSKCGEKSGDNLNQGLETNPQNTNEYSVEMAEQADDQSETGKTITMNVDTNADEHVLSDDDFSLISEAADVGNEAALVNTTLNKSPDMHTIEVDMSGYNPADIKITCRGRDVILRAKQERGASNGDRTLNEMHRTFVLPPEVDVRRLSCQLTDDGKMKLTAPKIKGIDIQEHSIPITMETAEN